MSLDGKKEEKADEIGQDVMGLNMRVEQLKSELEHPVKGDGYADYTGWEDFGGAEEGAE